MSVEIRETGPQSLSQYALIPIGFKVETVFRVEIVDKGLGGFALVEEEVDAPYIKDYDNHDNDDSRPSRWPRKFDVSKWGFFLAFEQNRAVGGATVAFNTPGVNMLEGRKDLAVLWDIRVHPDRRRQGIGTSLFKRAADWARQKECRQVKIETQNVNVPACRFYAGHGCVLGAINRHGYAGCPEVAQETMLIWYLEL